MQVASLLHVSLVEGASNFLAVKCTGSLVFIVFWVRSEFSPRLPWSDLSKAWCAIEVILVMQVATRKLAYH